jgi:hypothetical protein
MQIIIDTENADTMLQSLKDIYSAIENNSIENNELMDGSYRVNNSIVEFVDYEC